MDQTVFFEAAGLAGVAFYLGSYALLQFGVLRGNGYPYAVLNLLAASLVLLSLFNGWNLYSAIIQISWITISIFGMVRVWVLTRGLRFSDEEEELRLRYFPHMRRLDAKRFFQNGEWVDAGHGHSLTKADSPVRHLNYIASGGADVVIGGKIIASVGGGGFIGEMACLAQGPASATVAVNQPSRLFCISSGALNRMIRRNAEMGAHLEAAFSRNVRDKLVATNALLHEAMQSKAAS